MFFLEHLSFLQALQKICLLMLFTTNNTGEHSNVVRRWRVVVGQHCDEGNPQVYSTTTSTNNMRNTMFICFCAYMYICFINIYFTALCSFIVSRHAMCLVFCVCVYVYGKYKFTLGHIRINMK